jgi:DNA-binding Lrp family transcriptional regulator
MRTRVLSAATGSAAARAAREPQVTAHTLLRLHPKRTESVITALKKQLEVKGVYALSGDYDVLVMLRADRMEQIDAAIDLWVELKEWRGRGRRLCWR